MLLMYADMWSRVKMQVVLNACQYLFHKPWRTERILSSNMGRWAELAHMDMATLAEEQLAVLA